MIPQLLLEEIALGEKKQEDYYDDYGKDNLTLALKELENSNQIIRKTNPNDNNFNNFSKDKKNPLKKSVFPLLRFSRYTSFAAAALLVLIVSVPLFIKHKSLQSQNNIERVKGSNFPILNLYKLEKNEIIKLNNKDFVSEGDVIQISYFSQENDYGFIFSFDGNGTITRHFPENSWISEKIPIKSREIPLPFSYKLDDAPNYECFVFVTSDKSFSLEELNNVSSLTLMQINKGKYIPKGCKKTVIELKK